MNKFLSTKVLSTTALVALMMAAAPKTANATSDFTIDSGNANQGAQATQSAIIYGDPSNSDPDAQYPNNANGDIEINGTFTKTISNLPTPTVDGRYLRIVMPISLDYTYDFDQNQFIGATGTIQNKSVYVSNSNGNQQVDHEEAIMRFVGFEKVQTGNSLDDVEYVDVVNHSDKNQVQVPLQFTISGPATTVQSYTVKDITSKLTQDITMQKNSNINLKLGLVPGQTVSNSDLVQQATSLTKHNLKLEFEYNGQ